MEFVRKTFLRKRDTVTGELRWQMLNVRSVWDGWLCDDLLRALFEFPDTVERIAISLYSHPAADRQKAYVKPSNQSCGFPGLIIANDAPEPVRGTEVCDEAFDRLLKLLSDKTVYIGVWYDG